MSKIKSESLAVGGDNGISMTVTRPVMNNHPHLLEFVPLAQTIGYLRPKLLMRLVLLYI